MVSLKVKTSNGKSRRPLIEEKLHRISMCVICEGFVLGAVAEQKWLKGGNHKRSASRNNYRPAK